MNLDSDAPRGIGEALISGPFSEAFVIPPFRQSRLMGLQFKAGGAFLFFDPPACELHNLHISLTLNGETMQDSNTSNLIFKVPYLISYFSQAVTWETGDLISTGTPPGVGVLRKPQVFLKAGDTVSITVERLGTLTNPVAGPQ